MPDSRNLVTPPTRDLAIGDNVTSLNRRAFVAASGAVLAGAALIGQVGGAVAEPAPRLLVDRMLMRTARWLRAAGYDAEVPSAKAGRAAIVQRALRENRVLLSTNPAFAEQEDASARFLLLADVRVPETAAELASRVGVDWLHDPLSRCMPCNEALHVIDTDDVRFSSVHLGMARVTHCGRCDQLYWHGDHVDQILARLNHWAAGQFV